MRGRAQEGDLWQSKGWGGRANAYTHRHTHMRAHLILDLLVGFSSLDLPCVCSLHLSLQTSQHTSTVAAPVAWWSQNQGLSALSHVHSTTMYMDYCDRVSGTTLRRPSNSLPLNFVAQCRWVAHPWCIPCLQFLYHCWNLSVLDVTTNKALHN